MKVKGHLYRFSNTRQSFKAPGIQSSAEDATLNTDLQNECMAQYLADLISVAGHQLNGKSIEGSTLVNRLIEERVTLERIRPLEEKLKYKIDKLTKIAHGNIDKNDPLQIKPNVENLDLSGKERGSARELRKN